MAKAPLSLEAKIKAGYRVDPETGCWNWTGTLTASGYGQVCTGRSKHASAHRVAYSLFVGEIPKGLFACHRCDNRRCINPAHLFLGTAKDNADDMVRKGRQMRGESHYAAKLKTEQVDSIRADGREYREIAADYGVSHALVGHIKRGKAWRSVPWR